MTAAMTAQQVRQALYTRYTHEGWAVVFEVLTGDDTGRPRGQRRIDALLVRRAKKPVVTSRQRSQWWNQAQVDRTSARSAAEAAGVAALFPEPPPAPAPPPVTALPNGGLQRIAVEIKVTRGDFLQDVKHPEKQAEWRTLAEQHTYCTPAGLIDPTELPAGSGLLEVHGRSLRWAVKAPRFVTPRPLPLTIQIDAFYRWARAEALTRGLCHQAEGSQDEAGVRAELARLQHERELWERERERMLAEIEVWKQRFGICKPLPCRFCNQPLRPARRGVTSGVLLWAHTAADEKVCEPMRDKRGAFRGLPEPAAYETMPV